MFYTMQLDNTFNEDHLESYLLFMQLRKDKQKDKYETIDHPKTWYYWYCSRNE